MLDFPSSPNVGQVVTLGGITWTWDGVKWTAAGTGAGIYVPLTGGTMTGDLILNRDAQVALGAATLEQVNARGAGDNRLINGDMRIDQRGVASGSGGTANGYTADRWGYNGTQATKGTWQRGSSFPVPEFPYSLTFTSSSAYTPTASDGFQWYQTIEADMVSDFCWGTANAKSATLSFWAGSTLGGTFSGCVSNFAGTRSYPFNFTLIANVWAKIVIAIPGDTSGAWVMSGNAGSVVVHFDLGAGSTMRGPANVWASASYIGATGAVSVVATNGAALGFTGVKLEIGSVATPFNRQSLAKSMADCQRYYETGTLTASANGTTAAAFVMMGSFNAFKRATPTVTPTNSASSGVNATPNAFTITQQAFAIYHLATATATCSFTDTWIASAEL